MFILPLDLYLVIYIYINKNEKTFFYVKMQNSLQGWRVMNYFYQCVLCISTTLYIYIYAWNFFLSALQKSRTFLRVLKYFNFTDYILLYLLK